MPEDDRHVLVAEYLWLNEGNEYRYDPDAGASIALLDSFDGSEEIVAHLSLRAGQVLIDREDRPRFAIGRNESDELAITWQPEPDGVWSSFAFPGFAEKSLTPVMLADGDRAALFIGRREHDPRKALYRVDLQTHAAVKLYEHPEVDVDAAIEDLTQEHVIGVRVEADQPEYHWIAADNPSVKLYESLQRAFPGQSVDITSTDRRPAPGHRARAV